MGERQQQQQQLEVDLLPDPRFRTRARPPTGSRFTLVDMPTIRELEEALARELPEDAEQERWDPARTLLSPEAMRWSMEKESAPIAMRDALLSVLAEARATNRFARWTLVVAALALVCSAVSVALTLL